jgi:hypothetical protein
MIELLLPFGSDTLEYSWVKDTIDICTLLDYSMAKKCQQALGAAYWCECRCVQCNIPDVKHII